MTFSLRVAFTEDNWSSRVHHAPLIQATPGLEVAGYVQIPQESKDVPSYPPMPAVAKESLASKTWPDTKSMLQDPTIDIVSVTNSISQRYDLVKASLQAGKHVVVRAPPAKTSAQVSELIQLSEEKGKLLCPFFCHRYDGDYNTVAALLKYNNELGEFSFVESNFACRLAEGSEWLDAGSHIIDQVHHLFGMPKSLVAKRGEKVHQVSMQYGDELDISVNWGEKFREEPPVRRFSVKAAKGSFEKFYEDPQLVQLSKNMSPMDPEFGVEPEDRYGTIKSTSSHGEEQTRTYPTIRTPTQRGLYVDFLEAVGHERDVPCSAEDARDALTILEVIAQSLPDGRRVGLA